LGHRAPEAGIFDEVSAPANLPALGSDVLQPLRDVLTDPAVPKSGHDIKQVCLALRRAGVELAGVRYDSMLARFVLDPGRRSHDLDVLASEFLGIAHRPPADVARQGRGLRSLAEVPVTDVGA